MVQGDIDPSIPGTGVPVVAVPEKFKNENPEGYTIYAGAMLSQNIKRARFHQRRILAVIKHPCPTLMCAVRTCGL
jgi:hypothetical protein